jgi:hypothetical protein
LIGRAVVLKYTPHLKFVIDEAIERGNRVLEIIDEIERSSGSSSPESTKPIANEGPSKDR